MYARHKLSEKLVSCHKQGTKSSGYSCLFPSDWSLDWGICFELPWAQGEAVQAKLWVACQHNSRLNDLSISQYRSAMHRQKLPTGRGII